MIFIEIYEFLRFFLRGIFEDNSSRNIQVMKQRIWDDIEQCTLICFGGRTKLQK